MSLILSSPLYTTVTPVSFSIFPSRGGSEPPPVLPGVAAQDSPPSVGGRRPRNRCGCPQQLPPPGAAGRHPKEPLRPPAAADPRSRRCPQQLHSPQAPTREIQRLLGRARPGQSAEATAASPSSRSEVRFRSPKVMIDCAKC